MRVGILGSGDVGQALGTAFATLEHDVKMGSRDPKSEKVRGWVSKNGPRASGGTFAETAVFADVAVLATLGSGTESAIKLAEPKSLAGKIVIDATNPLVLKPGEPPALALGHNDSGGEQVQRWLPQSMVVKAFNMIGHAYMFRPQFPGGPPDMFYCGNDAGAKNRVGDILTSFGFEALDIGGIEGARLLEPLCILWVLYGLKTNGWNHAFKFLKR
jgi:hypothetical protein